MAPVSDSPHAYVEDLRAKNRALRAQLVQALHEKQQLEDALLRVAFDTMNHRFKEMIKGD